MGIESLILKLEGSVFTTRPSLAWWIWILNMSKWVNLCFHNYWLVKKNNYSGNLVEFKYSLDWFCSRKTYILHIRKNDVGEFEMYDVIIKEEEDYRFGKNAFPFCSNICRPSKRMTLSSISFIWFLLVSFIIYLILTITIAGGY